MCNRIIILFSFLVVFGLNINAFEYEAKLLNTETISEVEQWRYGKCFINDQQHVVGICKVDKKYPIYFIDQNKKIKFIDSKYQSMSPVALNNLGQIVGYIIENGKNSSLFLWSENFGIKKIDIFKSEDVRPIDLNDCNQILGEYKTSDNKFRPFIWSNDLSQDLGLGSKFVQQIEFYGFNVTNIKITSINNNGDIVGFITNGKYNEKQKKYIGFESFSFFWDGTLHIIPVHLPLLNGQDNYFILKLNNEGYVLVSNIGDGNSYIWHKFDGLKTLDDFTGKDINDSNVVLGYNSIWLEDKFYTFADLLGVRDINNMATAYSDTYSIERISCGRDAILGLNNKGQILCMAYIWGIWHPCILDPNEDFLK